MLYANLSSSLTLHHLAAGKSRVPLLMQLQLALFFQVDVRCTLLPTGGSTSHAFLLLEPKRVSRNVCAL